MVLGRQWSKHDKLDLGYQPSSSRDKVTSYVRVTYNNGTSEASRMNNAKKAFGLIKIAK